MNENLVQRLKIVAALLGLNRKQDLADALGVGRTKLFYIERTPAMADEQFVRSLETLEQKAQDAGFDVRRSLPDSTPDVSSQSIKSREIPIVSWAHAGEAESYEEIPHGWREWLPTTCRDSKAFAVRLIGDSMAPRFEEGDVLILEPEREIFSGCLAVLRFKSDGVIFRRVEVREDRLILVPLNDRYAAEEVPKLDVAWAYPVFGSWRQIWT